ncbi:NADPH-dependent FMN reductase [Goodfellowiella coeruleoviolacea]|uniref:NAD(P)H-dependent FMN reductase n=1 Tax=Goodfellowiella coeruleoviolacea TaxID=334858 RepID=A0AAE3GF17_9PSEU|nr:NAD(P)H-dependent oxidoreductase [Goodfellowiella coeruleoviolacea]MCP2167057.1 NAD(P)H-dependent FMN reductase [Goodfellowiella coeruleoviolacea]
MNIENLNLAVITASVRQGRFGPVVTDWFATQARQHGQFTVDLIDLAEVALPLSLPNASPKAEGDAYPRPAEMADLTGRLAAADAFVVVTPEYNHSFPASIKSLIDWHYTQWQAKPVGFVSYGGISGGLRAVEQLRLVFAEMHAVTTQASVSFANYWEQFDATGQPSRPDLANEAAKLLLDQLWWWGGALHRARRDTPYAEISA